MDFFLGGGVDIFFCPPSLIFTWFNLKYLDRLRRFFFKSQKKLILTNATPLFS